MSPYRPTQYHGCICKEMRGMEARVASVYFSWWVCGEQILKEGDVVEAVNVIVR